LVTRLSSALLSISNLSIYFILFSALSHRGPIWININFLALGALQHYSKVPGPEQAHCAQLYKSLRENVLRTVLGEYHRTGFLWEQFDDKEGVGIRGHPFSGWTALVVNIMAERYY
jgi:mannosyl-oligosaccharide glucosidase